MNIERFKLENSAPIHHRFGEPSPRPDAPFSSDPRLDLDDQALRDASRNAFPVVARHRARRDHLGLAAGAAFALVLGGVTFLSMSSGRDPASQPETQTVGGQTSLDTQIDPMSRGMPMAGPQAVPVTGAMVTPGTAVHPDQMPQMFSPAGQPQAIHSGAGSAPVLVFDGGAPPVAAGSAAGGNAHQGHGAPQMLGGAALASASADGAARSTRLEEPSNTVVQGTLIPAVLETAINTDTPGYARAVVSQDVRSFDGSRVLIPRSSRLIGEYKAATSAGQRRAYLMWTRLLRPDGVSIALASPAVDFSGQAGVTGKVNAHFFSRFGSAILLSVLGGAANLASGGASVIMTGGQSAASVAAERDSSRAATIRVRQGEPIRVFTAKDLIFNTDGAAE